MPVVRLSRGRFRPEMFETVRQHLEEGRVTLDPAIRRLDGLLHYYVGVDRPTSTMVNVSLWATEADAQQMASLKEMRDQRDIFLALGVEFDPIANYEPVWDIKP